jgi:hypothetical protein
LPVIATSAAAQAMKKPAAVIEPNTGLPNGPSAALELAVGLAAGAGGRGLAKGRRVDGTAIPSLAAVG